MENLATLTNYSKTEEDILFRVLMSIEEYRERIVMTFHDNSVF